MGLEPLASSLPIQCSNHCTNEAYDRKRLNFVIFILLYIASFAHITKTGENGNLKPTWFNTLLGALSSDISPKPSIAQQAKIGLYPILWSDFEEWPNFELLQD